MLIGLVGPAAAGDGEPLRDAIEFLLGDVGVEQVLYLGPDDRFIDDEIEAWRREVTGARPFVDELAEAVASGTAEALTALLDADAWREKLGRVRKLPPPPARAVEMIADRILIGVHDKSILDEEDIANAHVIVYGKPAKEAGCKRFGPRYFLTPGPATAGRVAVIDLEEDGHVSLAIFETSGVPVWREQMSRRTAKISVAR